MQGVSWGEDMGGSHYVARGRVVRESSFGGILIRASRDLELKVSHMFHYVLIVAKLASLFS